MVVSVLISQSLRMVHEHQAQKRPSYPRFARAVSLDVILCACITSSRWKYYEITTMFRIPILLLPYQVDFSYERHVLLAAVTETTKLSVTGRIRLPVRTAGISEETHMTPFRMYTFHSTGLCS